MNDVRIPVLGNRKHKSSSGLCSGEGWKSDEEQGGDQGGVSAAQSQETLWAGPGVGVAAGELPPGSQEASQGRLEDSCSFFWPLGLICCFSSFSFFCLSPLFSCRSDLAKFPSSFANFRVLSFVSSNTVS